MSSVDIETMQVPSELAQMMNLYRERKPKRVLEIGSWEGGTIREWLTNAAEGATVVAVDLLHRNADLYADWVRPDVEFLTYTGSSLEDEGREFIEKNGPYDWMLVDGDHSLRGASLDVDICIRCANPGALMLIHDITPPTGDESSPPGEVFAHLQDNYETWTYQDLTPATWTRGIGVVQL